MTFATVEFRQDLVTLARPRLATLGLAMVAFSGHKGLLGPAGTGCLYIAPGLDPEPLIRGGTGSRSASAEQPDELPDRLESVLSVIYLVFNEGYSASSGAQLTRPRKDDAQKLSEVLRASSASGTTAANGTTTSTASTPRCSTSAGR